MATKTWVKVDLYIYSGDTFHKVFVLGGIADPVDLTGCAIIAGMRLAGQTDVVDIPVTIDPDQVGAGQGYVYLDFTPIQSQDLTVGNYTWDFQFTDAGGTVTTLMRGKVQVEGDIVE